MPANLNALIRYKTIDRLLGTGRKYTIHELREHCTAALEESKGMDRMVSKRTIQEDIRVLRSDILGFNAPIENRSGYYFYSDPHYSIFETRISNVDILKRIYVFLFRIRKLVDDIHLDLLLYDIGKVLPDDQVQLAENRTAGFRDHVIGETKIRHDVAEEAINDGNADISQEVKSENDEKLERILRDFPDEEKGVIRFRRSTAGFASSQEKVPREAAEIFVFPWGSVLEIMDKGR